MYMCTCFYSTWCGLKLESLGTRLYLRHSAQWELSTLLIWWFGSGSQLETCRCIHPQNSFCISVATPVSDIQLCHLVWADQKRRACFQSDTGDLNSIPLCSRNSENATEVTVGICSSNVIIIRYCIILNNTLCLYAQFNFTRRSLKTRLVIIADTAQACYTDRHALAVQELCHRQVHSDPTFTPYTPYSARMSPGIPISLWDFIWKV